MSLIAIIDYGVGNLRSVQKAFEKLGFTVVITHDKEEILKAQGLILPGVGAFDAAMKELTGSGLDQVIKKFISTGKPFLGLCLGLQLLFSKSEEGKLPGLDILKGESKRFDFQVLSPTSDVRRQEKDIGHRTWDLGRLKIPQMGWNTIKMCQMSNEGNIFMGIQDDSYMYFVHSYYVVPEDPEVIATTTEYGIEFCSTVAKDNIFATQYHPEKSGEVGLKILENFGKLC